jgi:hypothetical protein
MVAGGAFLNSGGGGGRGRGSAVRPQPEGKAGRPGYFPKFLSISCGFWAPSSRFLRTGGGEDDSLFLGEYGSRGQSALTHTSIHCCFRPVLSMQSLGDLVVFPFCLRAR